MPYVLFRISFLMLHLQVRILMPILCVGAKLGSLDLTKPWVPIEVWMLQS